MAEGAKQRGLAVIGLLSKAHCEQAKPAHPSGKKLIDVADVVLDNGAPVGDSLLAIDGCRHKTGPFSTIGGAMVMNMLRCEVGGPIGRARHRAGIPAKPPVRRQPDRGRGAGILLCPVRAARRTALRASRRAGGVSPPLNHGPTSG